MRVEDAAHQALDDVGIVLGEVGAGEPDVGDQLVGGRRW